MDMFQPGGSSPKKMLIVDDDPSIVRVLADRCSRIGFDVETATNGIQAVIKANRAKPDVLVIDVNMPEVDGLSVCAHLLQPHRESLHVVIVTGSRNPETVERCERVGAFYAHKGVDFWRELEFALAAIYPELEERMERSGMRPQVGVRNRPRVLLVDDDPEVTEFLTSRLENRGVDILCASDALQGYRIACREEPTVIVADYFMPDGDALYLLSRLRMTHETEKLPVIVLSGRDLGEATMRALTRDIGGHPGAAQILKKSSDTTELFAALQKFCGFRGAPDGGARH